jgi:dephospho-CoA kinase
VRVEIVPYDPAWPDRAAALIAGLREVLGPRARRIEHIGSTAIAGMAAKNVIDLQASVADLESAARDFDRPLAAQGFRLVPYEHDHVPAGFGDDPARWVKRLWSRRGHAAGDVNLHVRLAGSPNERVALLFRDWLRAHPAAVPAYSAFKRGLAGAVADLGVYTDVKDPVVDLVIAAAETWATETGWSA